MLLYRENQKGAESMKKITLILAVCLCLLLVCSACSEGGGTEAAAKPRTVDLDLSVLSGTFVYAEVYNLMAEPQDYMGKTIKIRGIYSVFQEPSTGVVYHACVIPDATACCMQGIEFVWGGDHVWPDDYGEEGGTVTVTGRLESYLDGGITYLHLVDSDVVWEGAEVI